MHTAAQGKQDPNSTWLAVFMIYGDALWLMGFNLSIYNEKTSKLFCFSSKSSIDPPSFYHHLLPPPCWFSAVQLCLRIRLVKSRRQLLLECFGRFMQGSGWLAIVSISQRRLEERNKGGGMKGRKESRKEGQRKSGLQPETCLRRFFDAQYLIHIANARCTLIY